MELHLSIVVYFTFMIISVGAQINGVDYENSVIISSPMTSVFTPKVHIIMVPGTLYDMAKDRFNSYTFGLTESRTRIVSMEVDYRRKLLYFYDVYVGSIGVITGLDWQSNFTNVRKANFHNGLSRDDSVRLGIDWIANNIYWTDQLFKWIAVQSADNSTAYKVLIRENLERPYALVVDPIHRFLFWSDIGSSVKIERSSLSGQDRKTIISTGLISPTSIDIDQKSNTIVWVDSVKDTIESANFDGSERRAIQRMSQSSFFDVVVFQDLICVTRVQNKSNVIVNKNTGSIFNTLRNNKDEPFLALALYSQEVQPLQTDICNNSGCSDLCIPDASGPLCMCREGFMLNHDRKTCSPDLGKFQRAFVWSNMTHICLMDIRILTTKNWGDVMECVYAEGSSISFLDIDMNERKIVYADGSNIFVVDIEQISAKSRLVASKSPITGLAIDWRDNNVYWSEGVGSGNIKLVSQTTMDVYTLVDSDLVSPRNLLLLPLIKILI